MNQHSIQTSSSKIYYLTRILKIFFLRNYLDIFLKQYPGAIYGATLDGENFNNVEMISPGILVLGNESRGISSKIINLLSKKTTIPSSSKNNHIESLNVSSAAGILLSRLAK